MTKHDAHILLVDDDTVVRELFTFLLNVAGFQVTSVESAEEALAYLQSVPCDVVITDASLPNKSGMDLIIPARNEYHADVIVITGDAREQTEAEAICKGASDFIVKPVQPEELILRLHRVLDKRTMRRAQETVQKNPPADSRSHSG